MNRKSQENVIHKGKGERGGGGICPPTPEYILRIAIAGERRISRSKLVYPVSFVHAIHANGSVL